MQQDARSDLNAYFVLRTEKINPSICMQQALDHCAGGRHPAAADAPGPIVPAGSRVQSKLSPCADRLTLRHTAVVFKSELMHVQVEETPQLLILRAQVFLQKADFSEIEKLC